MKGLINKYGLLAVERAGQMQAQGCPFQSHTDDQFPGYGATLCGDWCPLFREPEPGMKFVRDDKLPEMFKPVPDGATELSICHDRTFIFDEFTDERGEE